MKRFLAIIMTLLTLAGAWGQGLVLSQKGGPFFRFVIIVDGSTGMRKNVDATVRTVQMLLASGFQGMAKDGDVFGVWTVNDELNATRYPPEKFLSSISHMQTIRASRFVSELKFRGSADLARAVEGMKEVLKVSKQTHYFLITDGSEVVYGTPFDLEISTTLIRYKNEMADKKLPFVVTLACQDGGFESYSVDSGGGSPIFIPKLVESEPEPPAQKQSKDRAQEEIFPDRKINLPGEKRVDEQKVDVGVKLPSDPEVEIGKKDPATAETNDASAPPPNIEGGHPEKMPSGSDSLREKSRKPSDSSISPPAEVYDEPLSGKQVMESSEPAASPKEAEINTDELEGPKSSSISVSPVTDSIISVGASIEKGLSPTTVEVEIASASASASSASGESRSEKNAEGTGGAVKEVVVSARPNVETNKVLKPEEDAETLAVLQPRVVMPEERRFPYLVVGLFGVVVLIGGIVLRGRGSSGESSIITQSFEKEE